MSRGLTWKHGYRNCQAKNRKGEPCGNKVPVGYRLCHVHRRQVDRKRAT